MANEDHLARLKQGVEVWNAWRDRKPAIQPDLFGADLTGEMLHRVNLAGSIRSEATFHNTGLSGADLSWATLHRANLSEADRSGVNLHRTELSRVILRNAILVGAYLDQANLSGTTLFGADRGRKRRPRTF
jgi:uncharacterized protein YjbI with pentapeptide repeats